MNQFSQKLVADKTKKPNQHLKEMLSTSIVYDKDLPWRNIKDFTNHRFLILVKNTGVVPKRTDMQEVVQAKDSIGNCVTGANIETIDVVKQMGDQLPPGIAKYINEQKYEDPTDWFGKKFAGKPICAEEKPDPKEKKAAAK